MSPASAALTGHTGGPAEPDVRSSAGPLDEEERAQLGRLRRWGTTGALLMALGATSSYGAATPNPNPVDGVRIIGLISRVSTGALGISYAGMGLLVISWLLLGRLAAPGRARRLSRSQLSHTLAMWTVPFLVTPPIFSRDVYSYLAVGSMALRGFNPYEMGPYDALGDGDVFVHQADGRWQHTPTPYGPAFILIAKGIVAISGQHVVVGVLLQRLVELIGVAGIIWALPRLARRCGLDPVSALWLGALNPLVLFHLIAGGHNEALMLGAMLVGLEWGLGRSWVGGTMLISFAVAIKATAGLALPFLVVALALRRSVGWKPLLRQVILVGAVAAATFAALTVIAGYGLGWINGLGAPGTVRSFLSISTSLAVGAGALGRVLGLGDHTDAAVAVLQPAGTAVGGLLAVGFVWLAWRGVPWINEGRRVPPILALGLALSCFVLLGPVIQPWYLLWAVLPLAAATGDRRFRGAATLFTAAYALIIMPNGMTIPVFTIVQAVVAAAVVAGIMLILLWRSGLPTSVAAPAQTVDDDDHYGAQRQRPAYVPAEVADDTASGRRFAPRRGARSENRQRATGRPSGANRRR
ncbi:polyprenol phosphomannose-dependent alpha 1,6 mannosyltransferase MptB [Nakamurella aerolata]|uniref:Polyprenol phosphomannose-dependent alpha 1,6 mannosyltransferase MptB n=1 Tax=Nakamurella aerolata TaxID=1656892 RepID=A0A849A583_9ACTN|nr:polyprenol phosphomannose-dependent alpha 1,6 mannosyltransferase MptB [Nakamurella aerolata]